MPRCMFIAFQVAQGTKVDRFELWQAAAECVDLLVAGGAEGVEVFRVLRWTNDEHEIFERMDYPAEAQ